MKRILLLLILSLNSAWCQWQIQTLPGSPTIRALDASGPDHIWLSGSKGSLFISTDRGNTWENRCPEEYKHLDFRGIAVLSDTVIIAMSAGEGEDGKAVVIKSGDKGKTWRKVLQKTEPGTFFDGIKFKSPWTGFILGDPIDAYPYLLKTVDAGETWERVKNLPPIEEGEASFASSNSGIATLGDNIWFHTQNRVFHSNNSGEYWQVHNTLFLKGKSQGIFGLFALDPYTLIAVGGDYLPHKEPVLQYSLSGSSGQAWYTQKEFWKVGLTECISSFGEKKHLISVGTHGTAISQDSGYSWKPLDQASFHVVKCFGNTCLAAGGEGKVGIISL
ncbi:WD40/YVTN/BNR-like repeat-containing protein [Leadbetterella byssophila]|uniref:Oxidoreductase, putative n=1 Tax=Leadbetterella byssophila (strain DSM 17132 / JCM 16389 / KACC 11308 / NBRC 106382 / 4M15) TaxID=649349 RepID=E4RTX6_LEAB4|nr:oxidoreductase [Leadbetterella byssophila]ADQ18684.1 oxidoreductase, putative [Leadbetterella byssophila DSM 17132]